MNTRPNDQTLLVIPTTRSASKSEATLADLSQYVVNHAHVAEQKTPGVGKTLEARVRFHPEIMDLCSLRSVRAAARRLCGESGLKHVDCLVLNAGLGGWTGVNWPLAIWGVLTDLIHQVTYPPFKISETGLVVRAQLPEAASEKWANASEEPKLGSVFCGNVFGHYVLAHELMPLLNSACQAQAARIIWVSSLESYASALHVTTDFQGIDNKLSYESSKRLTDVLALTSHLPSTSPWTSAFLSQPSGPAPAVNQRDNAKRPRLFTTHPGVCATSILPIPHILTYAMIGVFYFARWLGSIWHTVTPYKGATAAVWLALVSEGVLDTCELPHPQDYPPGNPLNATPEQVATILRPAKWGSATDAEGRERVEATEVEGWGWDGRPKSKSVRRQRGRMRGAVDLTEESRQDFDELGRTCWAEMERLRVEWTKRLDQAGV